MLKRLPNQYKNNDDIIKSLAVADGVANLSDRTIDEHQFDTLMYYLNGNPNIDSLNLSHCRLPAGAGHQLAELQYIKQLSVDGTTLSDADIKEIASKPNLHTLHITNIWLSDTTVQEITNNVSIKKLMLMDVDINKQSLVHLAHSQLQNLTLFGCGLNDESVDTLLENKTITRLSLPYNNIQGNIPNIVRNKTLKQLNLKNNDLRYSEPFLQSPTIEELHIEFNPSLESRDFSPIIGNQTLQKMHYRGCHISDEATKFIEAKLRQNQLVAEDRSNHGVEHNHSSGVTEIPTHELGVTQVLTFSPDIQGQQPRRA